MRLAVILCLAAAPLPAWEFSPGPVCTLSHGGKVEVQLTFDGETYAIHLTRTAGWPAAPVFAIRFDGPAGRTITTDRHRIDGPTLTVTDRGFGNVLNGLEFNDWATALIGDIAEPISLADAARPVQAFRDCPVRPSV